MRKRDGEQSAIFYDSYKPPKLQLSYIFSCMPVGWRFLINLDTFVFETLQLPTSFSHLFTVAVVAGGEQGTTWGLALVRASPKTQVDKNIFRYL